MVNVFVDVMARSVGVSSVASTMVRDIGRIGTNASRSFNEEFSRGINGAMSRDLQSQVAIQTRAMERASLQTVRAQNAVADVQTRVKISTQQALDMEAKYSTDSVRYLRAAGAREKAQRDLATATAAATTALNEQNAQQQLLMGGAAAARPGARLGRAANTAALGTIGVGAIISAESIKNAGNFQATQEKLVTTAGLAPEALKGVSDGVLKMSGEVGISAQNLSTAMYTVSSGMTHVQDPTKDAANALTILKASAQGAIQEQAPLPEVVDAVTTALKDYHMPATESANVTSKMIEAVSHGKTTFGEFSTALGQVQAQAAVAHVPMSDLYADMAQMTVHGIPAQQAAQNLNRAITTLQKPSADMTTNLANIGIKSSDLAGKLGTEGLAGTMQDISEAIIKHLDPATHTVLISAFNQSKVAAEDTAKAYDALGPSLQGYADKIKSGKLLATIPALEKQGLDRTDATRLSQFGQMYSKTTGLNANLTSLKNSDKSYNQMLIAATGNQESARVATQITGENAADTNATKGMVANAHADQAGDTQGWTEVQHNFNVEVAQTKAAVGAWSIELGTKLLPAATAVVDEVKTGVNWMHQHQNVTLAIIGTIGALVGAWATIKIATGIWRGLTTVVGGASAVIRGVGAAARFSGGLVSSAAGGVKSLATGARDYWNWTGKARANAIKDFVATKASAGAEAVKSGASWVAAGARSAGAWATMQAKAAGAFIATKAQAAASATASAASWVASNTRAAASFVLVRGAMLAQAAASRIAAAAQWLWDAAMSANPIGLIVVAIGALVAGVIYAYTHFTWFREGVQAVWKFLWNDIIKPYIGLIVGYIHMWADVAMWLWHNVIDPVVHGIGDLWSWLWSNIIKPVIDFVVTGIHTWGTTFTWLHDNVIKPVSDGIGTALGGVKNVFKDTVDWVQTQWGRLESIVKVPAKFIIDTVYNGGIEPLWNGIAGVFGLGKLDKIDVSKFAGGGIVPDGSGVLVPEAARALGVPGLPGYAPGVDNIAMRLASGGMAMFSPGEAFVDPAMFGGAQGLWAVNHHFSGGRPNANGAVPGKHFDIGGIIGDIGHGIADATKDVVGAVGDVASFATDPVGKLKSLFKSWIGKANGASDGSQFGKAITSVPSKMLDGAIDMVKGWFGSHSGGISGVAGLGVGGGVAAAPAQVTQWILQGLAADGLPATPGWIDGFRTLIMRESSGNPKAINLTDSNAKAGHPSQGLTQTIPSTFAAYHQPGTSNDITDPVASVAASANYVMRDYGVARDGHDFAARVQQANSAAGAKGYAGGGLVRMVGRALKFAGGGIVSGAQNAVNALKDHASTPYAWGGGSWGGLDCTGLVAAGILSAEGKPIGRLGDTTSMLAGKWPGLIRGASPSDAIIVGANATHAAMSILGTNFEERTSGETMRVGSAAVSPYDKQFIAQFHLDPTLINPPITAASMGADTSGSTLGASATISPAAQKKIDTLTAQIKTAQNAVDKDLADAVADDAAAKRDLANAAKAKTKEAHDALVANANQRTVGAKNARDQAEIQRKKAAALQEQLKALQSNAASTYVGGTGTTGDGSNATTNPIPMSAEEIGQKLGGLAVSGLLEATGLPDLTSSPLFQVPATIANAFLTHPIASPQKVGALPNSLAVPKAAPMRPPTVKAPAVPKPKKITAASHDDGNYLPVGYSINYNGHNQRERVLSPNEEALQTAAYQVIASGAASRSGGPSVAIEHWHDHTPDGGGAASRRLAREVAPLTNSYSGAHRR